MTKKLFLEGRLGTSICLHPVWDFSNTFLFPKIPNLLSLLDRSFDESFCRILQSCCRVLKICYLFGSQLIWQCHDVYIPSSKIGEENFSKKSVVTGQKILISKRGRQVNFSKGLLAIFGENRTLLMCSIISNMLHRIQYALRLIRGH